MSISESYGEAFGKRLNARATSFVTKALPKSTLAVTELRYEDPQFVLSTPPVAEDAFVVAVHFELFERYEYWQDGKAAPVATLLPGEAIIYDIRRQPTFHLNSPFHSVHFYFPILALHAMAEEAEARRIDELRYQPAVSHADPVLRCMAEALLPIFSCPQNANRLFLDHAMLAVGHHVASTYGGMQISMRPLVGGLSPLQERRAKEYIADNLSGAVPLAKIAAECGLSPSQFGRSFRKTVGMPPHRWLVLQRVSLAKSLLSRGDMTLAQIALTCGFADQSHFTQCFSTYTGLSPGVWRRSIQS